MNTAIRTTPAESADTQLSAEEGVGLSVLITVRGLDRAGPLRELYAECAAELDKTDLRYEFVFVVEREASEVTEELLRLKENSESRVKILVLGRRYGSATMLSVGVDYAAGAAILTVPAYLQVGEGAVTSLVSEMQNHDMVVLERSDGNEGAMARLADRVFRRPVRAMMGVRAYDTRRSAHIFRREVTDAIDVFGDKDRYLPFLARRLGFEVEVIEGEVGRRDGVEPNGSLVGGVSQTLDLLSVFFLTEFTQKPLRFFGFFGLISFSGGTLICIYLTLQRLFMGVSLADKPMLLLGILLIVLGALLLSIGLIGEMIIFTKSKGESKNIVEKVID